MSELEVFVPEAHFTVNLSNTKGYLSKTNFKFAKKNRGFLVQIKKPGDSRYVDVLIKVTEDAYAESRSGSHAVYVFKAVIEGDGVVTGSVVLRYNTKYRSIATLVPVAAG